jgi:serine/threonine-protein kinase
MPELPTTFGKYFLTEKLATGGMAEIYLAKIVGPGGFEKQLVIKQIHPKLTGQRHFVDLFVAEAKTLVTLAHGNIVPVYELGVIDDTYFIAMDYIDGPTLYRLTEMLARKESVMAPTIAAWITARIVEGLDYAHRKGDGVIHRDLSPRNVMLSRDGEVKLVDFGIAVTLGNAGEDESAQSAPTGSFPYMSPEQVRKEQLSGQTDLFSVGVLAWEMLTGQRLFARSDPDATLFAVTEGEIPRPSSVRPEVPEKLDEIVMKALERDKTARWSSAGEMLAALQRYLYGLDQMPGPRDVAALVAKYCPPETRRMPTHAGEHAVDSPAEPPVDPVGATEATPPPPAAGPATAVIPREAQARGKPIRHKSFATHVDMKDMLERATPLFGHAAVADGDEPPPAARPDSEDDLADTPPRIETKVVPRSRSQREDDTGAKVADAPDSTLQIRTGMRAGEPPAYQSLVVLGLGAIGLAVVAVILFFRMRDRGVAPPDAPPKYDAPFYMLPDAASEAPLPDAPDVEAPPIDAPPGPSDAGAKSASIDAGERPVTIDAGGRPTRIDAPERPVAIDAGAKPMVLDAAVVAPSGIGTVDVGDEPWGDIVVDGKKSGRTPATLTLPAGKHTIEVIFGGEDPPRTKSFTIDLGTGATEKRFADFTKP